MVAVASRLLPADIVQKLVLLLIFVLACSGAAALLDRAPVLARLAAAVFYGWNPYVAERLIIGQWALLIGYAGLPWVLRAVLALARDSTKRGVARAALALLPAVVGGFAAMVLSALVLVPVALCQQEHQDRRGGAGRARRRQPALARSRRCCTPCTPTRVAWPRSRRGPTPRSAPSAAWSCWAGCGTRRPCPRLRRALVRDLAGRGAGRPGRLRAARPQRGTGPGHGRGSPRPRWCRW